MSNHLHLDDAAHHSSKKVLQNHKPSCKENHNLSVLIRVWLLQLGIPLLALSSQHIREEPASQDDLAAI